MTFDTPLNEEALTLFLKRFGEESLKRRQAMECAWAAKWIPSAYKDTEPERLPDLDAAKLLFDFESQADDAPEITGAFVYGATGSGKTRSLFHRIRLGFYLGETEVVYIRGKALGDEIVERTRPGGSGELKKWFRTLESAEVLAIDELDKMAFTPRVLAEFFDLLENRVGNQATTIFVAQCPIDRLVDKIPSKAKAEAAGIVRRVKEFFTPIHFSKTK